MLKKEIFRRDFYTCCSNESTMQQIFKKITTSPLVFDNVTLNLPDMWNLYHELKTLDFKMVDLDSSGQKVKVKASWLSLRQCVLLLQSGGVEIMCLWLVLKRFTYRLLYIILNWDTISINNRKTMSKNIKIHFWFASTHKPPILFSKVSHILPR